VCGVIPVDFIFNHLPPTLAIGIVSQTEHFERENEGKERDTHKTCGRMTQGYDYINNIVNNVENGAVSVKRTVTLF
jgi:hypothetical protein